LEADEDLHSCGCDFEIGGEKVDDTDGREEGDPKEENRFSKWSVATYGG
jgi:hypothetical protein